MPTTTHTILTTPHTESSAARYARTRTHAAPITRYRAWHSPPRSTVREAAVRRASRSDSIRPSPLEPIGGRQHVPCIIALPRRLPARPQRLPAAPAPGDTPRGPTHPQRMLPTATTDQREPPERRRRDDTLAHRRRTRRPHGHVQKGRVLLVCGVRSTTAPRKRRCHHRASAAATSNAIARPRQVHPQHTRTHGRTRRSLCLTLTTHSPAPHIGLASNHTPRPTPPARTHGVHRRAAWRRAPTPPPSAADAASRELAMPVGVAMSTHAHSRPLRRSPPGDEPMATRAFGDGAVRARAPRASSLSRSSSRRSRRWRGTRR